MGAILGTIFTVYIVAVVAVCFAGTILFAGLALLIACDVVAARIRWRAISKAVARAPFDVSLWSTPDETVRRIDLPNGGTVTSRIPTRRTTLDDL